MFLLQPAAMEESYTLTIADSKVKHGKALFFLVALLCTSLLSHAACNCGFYLMNVVELEGEGAVYSIQSNAAMVSDLERNSSELLDYGSKFELLSVCAVVNHIIGYSDGFCMISLLEPSEVTSDHLFIASWRTEVIHSIEVVFLSVRFRSHDSLMQLILNTGECWFPTENEACLELFAKFEELNLELQLNQDVAVVFWSRYKKACLVVLIVIPLAFCVVHPQLMERRRINSIPVPQLAEKASNLNHSSSSSSSGANELSKPVEEPQKAIKIEPLIKSPETTTPPPPPPPSSSSGKEKCRRNRRKRRTSSSSSSSSQVLTPIVVAVDQAFVTVPKTVVKDKKPVDDDFLFRSANDQSMKIPTSTLALHARAPGPKQEMVKKITATINDPYVYDIWSDHLLEIVLSELWSSFFVKEPQFIVKSQTEHVVTSPYKGD